MISALPDGRVEFRFFRRDVNSVCVVGSFNRWQIGAAEMRGDGDGWWRARLVIPEGVHEFRYVADGQWFTDFAAHGVEHARHGLNSLLVIPPARAAA